MSDLRHATPREQESTLSPTPGRAGIEGAPLDVDDFALRYRVAGLWDTLGLAHVRCLPGSEIANHVREFEKVDETLLKVIAEREWAGEDAALLLSALEDLSSHADEFDARDRDRAYRIVRRAGRSLPADLAVVLVERFLDHPRRLGREVALTLLKDFGVPSQLVPAVVRQFRETGNERLAQLLLRKPEVPVELDLVDLLASLTDEYWQARALQHMLVRDSTAAYRLASKYPAQFARAVARAGDQVAGHVLRALLREHGRNIEFLSMYAYALGRLNRVGELEDLAAHVIRTFGRLPDEDVI